MLVDGLLPPGRMRVTEDEFHSMFVEAFPASKVREQLFDQWVRHRLALQSMLPLQAQWIDGSFVTDKVDPGDVDLVCMFDGPALDLVPPSTQAIAQLMLSGSSTKAIWGIDTYVLASYPEEHPNHEFYLMRRGYWDRWFGRVRGDENATKGYLEVVV